MRTALSSELRFPWVVAIPIALAFLGWVVAQPYTGRTRMVLLLSGVIILVPAVVRGVERLFVRYSTYLGPTIGLYALVLGGYVLVTGSLSDTLTVVVGPLCLAVAFGAGADAVWGSAAKPFTLGLLGCYLGLVSAYVVVTLGAIYAVPTGVISLLSLRDAVRYYRA